MKFARFNGPQPLGLATSAPVTETGCKTACSVMHCLIVKMWEGGKGALSRSSRFLAIESFVLCVSIPFR